MVDMAMSQILPAALHYTRDLCETVNAKKSLGASCRAESEIIQNLSTYTDILYDAIGALKSAIKKIPSDPALAAAYYHDTIVPDMNAIREAADKLELLTEKSYWPYPTYADCLYY